MMCIDNLGFEAVIFESDSMNPVKTVKVVGLHGVLSTILNPSHDQFIHPGNRNGNICADAIAKMASSCRDNGIPDWLKSIAEKDCQNNGFWQSIQTFGD